MTEEDVRRIVREELRKMLAAEPVPATQIDYRGSSPRFACMCAPGQCAVYGTAAAPTCPRNRGLMG